MKQEEEVVLHEEKDFLDITLAAFNPKVAIATCIDCRIRGGVTALLETLGYYPGQYFPWVTPGAINDLISDEQVIRHHAYKTVRLLADKVGITEFIIVPHTNCLADKAINTFADYEQDRAYQIEKIKKADKVMNGYSDCLKRDLRLRSFLIHIPYGTVPGEEAVGRISKISLIKETQVRSERLLPKDVIEPLNQNRVSAAR